MSSPTSCLEDTFIDRDVILLRPAIRRFVIEAKTTHSVDGYLILLGGLVFEIEESKGFRVFSYDPREILRKVLSCVEVAEALSPLTDYVEDVKYLVNSSPRHKLLRPYLDLITEFLSTMPPSGRKLVTIRPSLNELDRIPSEEPKLRTSNTYHIPVEVTGPSTLEKGWGDVIKKVLGYTSLVIISAGIIYFSYALLVKYGLIEPLAWIPLP